jgi:regulator of nucleoside diphosphate kinase
MKYGKIIVEKKEFGTLRRLMIESEPKTDGIYATSVAKLSEEFQHAETRENLKMPEDVVRLNSIVTVSTPMEREKTFQIVLPGLSNIAHNKLSILAPMGLALFGYAQGDEVMWQFPSGINNIKIIKVKQSEVGAVGTLVSF